MIAASEDGARVTQAHLPDRITEDLRHLRHGFFRRAVHAQLERIHLRALPQVARQLTGLVELARQRNTHPAVVSEAAVATQAVDRASGALGQRFLEAGGSLLGRLLPRLALLDVWVDCFTLFSNLSS